MSAQTVVPPVVPAPHDDDSLHDLDHAIEAARSHVAAQALTPAAVGKVGLELELHLVDLARPERRPDWSEVETLVAGLPVMPAGSPITLEPGGQIELSTPPGDDVVAAVEALRADEAALRTALRAAGFGAAALGTDPARPVRRINPGARYAAMEQHFDSMGHAGPGMQMMTATAALQVNLEAGLETDWEQRLALVRDLVPTLVAMSSTSPYLSGRSSGWHSMRQGTWRGMDHGRTDPVASGEPVSAWVLYALSAPVMLVREADGAMTPMTRRVSFASWLRGSAPIERRPTLADLDYHLTTLFPPVRPRGYVEIRCIDAAPDRWWPALAAITTVLLDVPEAAAQASEICAPVAEAWECAARDGLADPAVRRSVLACVDLAARHTPDGLKAEVESFAELLASGRTPSGVLRARAEEVGPLRLLQEEADV